MPEGDSIFRLAAQLAPALEGQPLVRCELARSSRLGLRPPRPGTVVEAVEAQGKHLLIRFDGGLVLRSHLGLHGGWRLLRSGQRWPRPRHRMRAVVEVEGWEAVCFDAPTVELERRPATTHLGPDLCDPDVDLDRVLARLASVGELDRGVAEALLDQRVAAGVGNIYKSETCFACGLDPRTPVEALGDEERRAVWATAARLLRANLGPGLRTTASGPPGSLAVYGRAGQPCRRCGTRVQVARTGPHARATYWCPTCQPASSTTAGALSR